MASWEEIAADIAAGVNEAFRRDAAATYSHAGGAAVALPEGVQLHNPRRRGGDAGRGLGGEIGADIERDLPRAEIPVADLAAAGVTSPDNGDRLTVGAAAFSVRAVEQNGDETVWILYLAPQPGA